MQSVYSTVHFVPAGHLHSPSPITTLTPNPTPLPPHPPLGPIPPPLLPYLLLCSIPEMGNYLLEESPCRAMRQGTACQICKAKKILQLCQAGNPGELAKCCQSRLLDQSISQNLVTLIKSLCKAQAGHRRLEHFKPAISTLLNTEPVKCGRCDSFEQGVIRAMGNRCHKCGSQLPTASCIIICQHKGILKHLTLTLSNATYLPFAILSHPSAFLNTNRIWHDLTTARPVGESTLFSRAINLVIWRKISPAPPAPTAAPPRLVRSSESKTSASRCHPRFKVIHKIRSKHSQRLTKSSAVRAKVPHKQAVIQTPPIPSEEVKVKGKGLRTEEVCEDEWLGRRFVPRMKDQWDREYDKGKVKKVRKKLPRQVIDFNSMVVRRQK